MHHACLSLTRCHLCGYEKSNTYCSLIDPHASLWLALGPSHLLCLHVIIWLVCNLFTTQIHMLLFHWFTYLLLFGLCIDHCLIHVLPFDWYLCQLIRQIIILNFILTPRILFHRVKWHYIIIQIIRHKKTGQNMLNRNVTITWK